MIKIPFDVNDAHVREEFLSRQMMEAITSLPELTPARWGNMSAHHMVEHLYWAFQCSTGALDVPCFTPEHLLERAQRFLYDSRLTPHFFKNPLLGETPPPFQFPSFTDAQTALRDECSRYLDLARSEPDAIHVHPIFGRLNGEQWHRSHFKHCYHHLSQFGLIEQQ